MKDMTTPATATPASPMPLTRPFRSMGPTTVDTGSVQDAAAVLRGRRIAVVTGAVMSTDSGIPDYRGEQSPVRTPMTYQQFRDDPDFRRRYWARNHVGWRHVHDTRPNAGHRALARMEAAGVVTGVITQNVDLLHEEAGSRNVIDLHGRYDWVECLTCGRLESRAHLAGRLEALNPGFAQAVEASTSNIEVAPDADADVPEDLARGFTPAPCQYCGGVLKPQIVYFGETVPRERADRALALVDASEALLVAGSSLVVQSGLRLVRRAVADGVPIVIINRGATRGDQFAQVKIDAGVSESLVALAKELGAGGDRVPGDDERRGSSPQ